MAKPLRFIPGLVAALIGLSAAAPPLATTSRTDDTSPWDGVWYFDAASSHFAQHSITLTRLANGFWKYDDGSSLCTFKPDGTSYPEEYAPDLMMTVTMSDRTLDMVTSGYGLDQERDRWILSAGAESVAVTGARVFPDGHGSSRASQMARVGKGMGFEGTWKEFADATASSKGGAAPAATAENFTSANPPHAAYWVISTSTQGMMTWFIPKTGELIRGRADGKKRPLTGPEQPAGRTFVWKRVSAMRIDFTAFDHGHPVEYAIEELSPDVDAFTDTLWSPGHEGEKDVRVFRRVAKQ
jgi:hypothetical protein